MKLFLDTSALLKLYQKEADSNLIEDLFDQYEVETIILSDLAKVEFASAVWKKFRTKEISSSQVVGLLKAFEKDASRYEFITTDRTIIEQAAYLLTKYGEQGLRTLDSIQLATAIFVRHQSGLFKSMDKLLHSFFQAESLKTT